jgi:hypothetical protein
VTLPGFMTLSLCKCRSGIHTDGADIGKSGVGVTGGIRANPMLHGPYMRTSGKRGFHPPPLVPKLFRSGLKGALVPVRAAGVRPAPSPGS